MEKEVIRIDNIVKNFKIGTVLVEALRSVSIVIEKNEFVAIMGPSGSGKSTMMNILGCLDTPTSGSYFLNGEDVSKMDDNSLAEIRNRQIGFVFQTFNLLPRSTALENVMLPLIYAGVSKGRRIERGKEVLDEVKLSDRMEHKPNELSGGQRQRVAIARALVNNPAIILADEPTGNLDSKTSIEILGLLEDIHKMGNTVIIVTHEEDIALHAHRIIRLMDGEISSDELNRHIKTIADFRRLQQAYHHDYRRCDARFLFMG
jgi:putative ABC transport system ATP-binding protein